MNNIHSAARYESSCFLEIKEAENLTDSFRHNLKFLKIQHKKWRILALPNRELYRSHIQGMLSNEGKS
jgi:hypothetical protein